MRLSDLVIVTTACLAVAISAIGCGVVKEEEAYIYGMESWVYGYPLVMMEVTREVLTAAPAPNSEGTAAPINQLAKMPLKFNADGSLDIYLPADSPGPDKETKWLPTPPGQFNLTLRNYFPKEAAWGGTYQVPPVKQVQ